jgi:hypothetical protein
MRRPDVYHAGSPCSLSNVGQDVHYLNDIVRCEQSFDVLCAEIGKCGFVEGCRTDVAAFGQVADDEFDCGRPPRTGFCLRQV